MYKRNCKLVPIHRVRYPVLLDALLVHDVHLECLDGGGEGDFGHLIGTRILWLLLVHRVVGVIACLQRLLRYRNDATGTRRDTDLVAVLVEAPLNLGRLIVLRIDQANIARHHQWVFHAVHHARKFLCLLLMFVLEIQVLDKHPVAVLDQEADHTLLALILASQYLHNIANEPIPTSHRLHKEVWVFVIG